MANTIFSWNGIGQAEVGGSATVYVAPLIESGNNVDRHKSIHLDFCFQVKASDQMSSLVIHVHKSHDELSDTSMDANDGTCFKREILTVSGNAPRFYRMYIPGVTIGPEEKCTIGITNLGAQAVHYAYCRRSHLLQ